MRQPTIDSHPYDDEICIVCGHPHSFDDGSGISQCCHCGHPEWDPERDGAVGGRLGMELREEIYRLGSMQRWQNDPDQTFVRPPTEQEIECVRYELAADTRTDEQKAENSRLYWERYVRDEPLLWPCQFQGPGYPCLHCGQERNDAVRLLGILRARAKMGDAHITRSGSAHKSHRPGRG